MLPVFFEAVCGVLLTGWSHCEGGKKACRVESSQINRDWPVHPNGAPRAYLGRAFELGWGKGEWDAGACCGGCSDDGFGRAGRRRRRLAPAGVGGARLLLELPCAGVYAGQQQEHVGAGFYASYRGRVSFREAEVSGHAGGLFDDAIPCCRCGSTYDDGQQRHRIGAEGYRDGIHQAQGSAEVAIPKLSILARSLGRYRGNQEISRWTRKK